MSQLGRLLLVVALALAVPAQAMSAVMAGLCMANSHHAAGAPSHDGTDPHHHHDAPADHPHQGDSSHGSGTHCPPASAVAAISGAVSIVFPEGAAAGPVTAAPCRVVGFQPDTLDRPPLAL